ncbi:MAG TPA: AMP-binding protein [Syntrophobacteria bacterium]|nr:AMP-binding protein [Syntrophobacteria bacterium]
MILAKASERTAIVWHGATVTYQDFLRHVHYYSSLFNAAAAPKIAIFSANRPEWAYAFYAGWKKGAVPVPVDFMATADEVAFILNDCRPEIVFCSKATLPTLEQARPLLKYDVKVRVVDDQEYDPARYGPEEISQTDLQKTAVIIYTSGTTGSPKGVMLSFDNLLANIEAVSDAIPIYSEDRTVLALLPFHHVFPLLGSLVAPLYVGSTIAFAPSMSPGDIIATLQENGVAIIIGVPRLYAAIRRGIMDKINKRLLTRLLFRLAAKVESRAFSRRLFKKVHQGFGGKVDYLVCGGAKLDEDVARDFKTLGFEMLEGYGMTEAAPMITFTRPGRWKIGAAGERMPCLEVKITEGEIVARGRNIMQGYHNRPVETAEALRNGWLHTGDIGHLDREGFMHVTARLKEIIVLSSGKNIDPVEIEGKIRDLSDCIAEVGIFPQDDSLHAAIHPNFDALRAKAILNIEEMFRWEVIDRYNRKASPHKKIAGFTLCKDELPKTRLGKIQRFKLPSLSDQGASRSRERRAEPDFEEYRVICDFLTGQTRREVHPDDHVELDLGLDSLDKVALLTFLQSTFGVDVDEDILLQHPTVEELSRFMERNKNKLTVESIKWADILKQKIDLKLPRSWFTQTLVKNFSRVFFKLYFRLKGEGVDNIPEGPFILASNHQSFFDGLFISVFLRNKMMKNTYFYAKEKHLRMGWLKALANRNNIIVMDINRDLKQSLQKLAEVLKRGKNVVIFPEGTRTRTGAVGTFKKAFAILSRELDVPVVPVSIRGAFAALPRGSFLPRPWKRIRITFHRPILPEGLSYETLAELVYRKVATEAP